MVRLPNKVIYKNVEYTLRPSVALRADDIVQSTFQIGQTSTSEKLKSTRQMIKILLYMYVYR